MLFVEPNPVTFYYSLAHDTEKDINKAKHRLEQALKIEGFNGGVESERVMAYSYVFKVSCVCIIFSALAIEAFMNQILPDHKEVKWRNKLATKEAIQRNASFKEKIEQIFPDLTKKDFSKRFPRKFETIKDLKLLRDRLTHLKNNQESFLTYYNDIYQEILDVDLKKITQAVKSLINYYEPNTIIEY